MKNTAPHQRCRAKHIPKGTSKIGKLKFITHNENIIQKLCEKLVWVQKQHWNTEGSACSHFWAQKKTSKRCQPVEVRNNAEITVFKVTRTSDVTILTIFFYRLAVEHGPKIGKEEARHTDNVTENKTKSVYMVSQLTAR